MKDSILNAALIAFAIVLIPFSAIDFSRSTLQPAMTESGRLLTMEKIVFTAQRLPADLDVDPAAPQSR